MWFGGGVIECGWITSCHLLLNTGRYDRGGIEKYGLLS
jgi:hypothetical protein